MERERERSAKPYQYIYNTKLKTAHYSKTHEKHMQKKRSGALVMYVHKSLQGQKRPAYYCTETKRDRAEKHVHVCCVE
jgi:hypothetical protein